MVQGALDELGVDDRIVAAGEFAPRGHTGSGFVGGLVGDELGGTLGMAAGMIGGRSYSDSQSGLPSSMVVAVSDTRVYGFAGNRQRLHSGVLFRLDRSEVTVEVHQRVNVRVVELIDQVSGSRLELEGNRLPVTHSKDVIDHLR